MIVGLVVLLIVVGGILATRAQRSETASLSGGVWVPSSTAQALPTRSLPFPDVPRIPVQEAWQAVQQGSAILVDVRSRAAYDKMHAAGATSMPEDEILARAAELPRDRVWILYCT
jgi:hypothetical protein